MTEMKMTYIKTKQELRKRVNQAIIETKIKLKKEQSFSEDFQNKELINGYRSYLVSLSNYEIKFETP